MGWFAVSACLSHARRKWGRVIRGKAAAVTIVRKSKCREFRNEETAQHPSHWPYPAGRSRNAGPGERVLHQDTDQWSAGFVRRRAPGGDEEDCDGYSHSA